MSSEQKDLFSSEGSGLPPITIELSGIEVQWLEKLPTGQRVSRTLRGIPGFKNSKRAFAWKDKVTGRVKTSLITLPQHQKWMERAILSIESQLRSALGITAEKIRTVACLRSWIASRVPLDDSWTWVPEVEIKSRLCEPGEEEGATIIIQRIR